MATHDDDMLPTTGPEVSVIVNTYRRRDGVLRALDAVLAQHHRSFQVIVVDDGSGDDTVDAIRSLGDQRVEVVEHENRGLGASRRSGASSAVGEWLVFLDDDDLPLPGWLEGLTARAADATCGIVCCAVRYRNEDGSVRSEVPPDDLGPLFDNVRGLFLAGSFAVRRDLYEAAGGYLAGMPCSHQTELAVRLIRVAAERGLSVVCTDDVLIEISGRSPDARPLSSPSVLFWGGRWLISRHQSLIARSPSVEADLRGVVGVSAARLGDLRQARRHLRRAAVCGPLDVRRWARLLVTLVPPVARRVWGVVDTPGRPPLAAVAAERARVGASDDLLFLPWGYSCNSQLSADRDGTPFWEGGLSANNVSFQEPVYRWAARLARTRSATCVMDIGCGSGDKLVRHLVPAAERVIGVDQPSGISLAAARFDSVEWCAGDFAESGLWDQLRENAPDLVLCADVIEHVEHPAALLDGIRSLLRDESVAVISTPDRARLRDARPLGPPLNPRHVREWSAEEMELLLESADLEIVERRHVLPRSYGFSIVEAKQMVWKVLHGRRVPDARYNVVFVVRTRR